MTLLFSLAAVAATFASSASAPATSGDFNVLSFNVAGLPAIFNSNDVPGDKATNAGTIGTLFAEYDYNVIHVQEDMCSVSSTFVFNPGNHVFQSNQKLTIQHISTTMPTSTPPMIIRIAQPLPVEQRSALGSTRWRILTGSALLV